MSSSYTGQAPETAGSGDWNRLDFAVRQILGGVCTSGPCEVVAVRGSVVDIRPTVNQLDGDEKAVPHGVIHNVPIWQYQAGASAIVLLPAVGDHGIALYAHSDISSVKANGGKASNPGSLRKHDWSDAVYLGGVLNQPATQTITVSDADGITVTSNRAVRIDAPELIVSGKITTGPGSSFNGVSFDTHRHSGVTSGTSASGPPGP